jgi:hypothetical protein
MTSKKCAAVAFALLLGLAAVGCGSKKDDSASSGDGGNAEKQSVANPDASSTTTGDHDSGSTSTTSGSDGLNSLNDITGGGATGDCIGASVAYATLVLEPLGFMGGATQEQIDKFEQDTKDLQAKIPSELQGDFQTVADAYKAYGDALKGIDFGDLFNPDTQKKMEDASSKLDDPDVKAAQDNIDAYFKDTCGG